MNATDACVVYPSKPRAKSASFSREKGARGEREFVKLIRDELGIETARNLEQYRESGVDIILLDRFSIEVRRREQLAVKSWFEDAVKRRQPDQIPVVAYRQSYKPWVVVIHIADMVSILGQPQTAWWGPCKDWLVQMPFPAFAFLVREFSHDT